jgi:hypothetical protein
MRECAEAPETMNSEAVNTTAAPKKRELRIRMV